MHLSTTRRHLGATCAARWLHSTEQRAWRGFLDLPAELSSLLNQDVQRTSGLPLADYDVLTHLTDVLDTRRRPSELAESLGWDKSRLSKQVARMQRGLVTREDCPGNRRGLYAVHTACGRRPVQMRQALNARQVRDEIHQPPGDTGARLRHRRGAAQDPARHIENSNRTGELPATVDPSWLFDAERGGCAR